MTTPSPSPSDTPATPASPAASPQAHDAVRVRFSTGNADVVVRITMNPTSRDFLSLLPLTLDFKDFSSMEKIGYLPRALTTEGSTGQTPSNGDLIYFIPWGNLGFFYNVDRRDASFDNQVIPIGVVESGFDHLPELEQGPVQVQVIA